MENYIKIEESEPKVTEQELWNFHNLPLAIFIGVFILIVETVIIVAFDLTLVTNLIMLIVTIILYAAILFFLLEPRVLRMVEKNTLKTIEKPVIKEVSVEKPVYIEKEVIRRIEVPVETPVYIPIEKPRKKLNIPKYDFVGSTQTKTYHTRNCRLGKLIKRKYKISSNSEKDFKKKKFSPCKVCITKEKKI